LPYPSVSLRSDFRSSRTPGCLAFRRENMPLIRSMARACGSAHCAPSPQRLHALRVIVSAMETPFPRHRRCLAFRPQHLPGQLPPRPMHPGQNHDRGRDGADRGSTRPAVGD